MRIAALGDSLTYGSIATWNGSGWTYSQAVNPYPAAVQAALGGTVTNHGVPGDTTAGMLARYVSDVRPEAPERVVILGGTNDLTAGTSAATIEANIDAIIAAAQADGATPILVTILPRGGTGPHGGAGLIAGGNAVLLAVNDWIRGRGLRYVDGYALFDDGAGKLALAYDSGDGVHLNQIGYDRLAAAVQATIAGVWIDKLAIRQRMDGFGAGICSHELIDEETMRLLTSRTTGLGLTLAREYVDTRGHFNDGSENGIDAGNPPRLPPYPPGVDLQNAILAAKHGMRFMAFSQWSPAAWRAEVSGGANKIPAAHYAEQAAKVATFLQQAADNGITIDAYSPGNEPDSPPWGLLFTAAEMHTFVHDHLIPAIAASAQPNCKVMLAECASSYSLASYINAFSAAGHLDDIGYTSHHDYAQTPQIPAGGKPFWQTEASANGSGLYWARRIHDYVSAGASAYLYLFFWAPGWYNASPDAGLLGKYADGKPLQKTGLAFAQFSRYVRPGDVRIDCSGAPAGVYATAYKRDDGAFTIVFVNENVAATAVDLSGIPGGFNALARHETIETVAIAPIGSAGNLARLADVAVAGGTASAVLSGKSVTTLSWEPPVAGNFRDRAGNAGVFRDRSGHSGTFRLR